MQELSGKLFLRVPQLSFLSRHLLIGQSGGTVSVARPCCRGSTWTPVQMVGHSQVQRKRIEHSLSPGRRVSGFKQIQGHAGGESLEGGWKGGGKAGIMEVEGGRRRIARCMWEA